MDNKLILSITAILSLQDDTKQTLKFYLSTGKDQLQELIKEKIGFLPSDCNACFWIDNDTINIALDKDASPGRIAHEAFHASAAIAQKKKLDPVDYGLIRPNQDDFGYVPAEVCADLCEQIVDTIDDYMKRFVRKRDCNKDDMKDIIKDAESLRKYRTTIKGHFSNNDKKRLLRMSNAKS